jgi:hypothetical protein
VAKDGLGARQSRRVLLTPHNEGYPAVLARLEAIARDELAERIEDAWLNQSPKRLAAEYLARSDSE